jgi:23S rRNA pseudouridine1911/1915/1917 synthase
MRAFEVIAEDNHLLVVNKPAGLVTQGALLGEASLHGLAAEYLKKRYDKPGNVFVGIVSRLDRSTSGIIVLARTSKSAARLTAQFQQGNSNKGYLAFVSSPWRGGRVTCVDWIRKDERQQRMVVASEGEPQAQRAAMVVEPIRSSPRGSLLAIRLLTGRKHQIRLQLAQAGHAIAGDRKYGSATAWPQGIALHSRRLAIDHPTRRETLCWVAALPDAWDGLSISIEELQRADDFFANDSTQANSSDGWSGDG